MESLLTSVCPLPLAQVDTVTVTGDCCYSWYKVRSSILNAVTLEVARSCRVLLQYQCDVQ